MRGRPAQPLEKALARGTEGAVARKRTAPKRVSGVPTPPSWFGPEELTCWVEVCDLLAARGQLSADSRHSLVALCQCYGQWVALAKTIREEGVSYWSTTGTGESVEKPKPQVVMLADADRRFKGWLTEFGLTDASRGKVTSDSPEAKADALDPLASYGLTH